MWSDLLVLFNAYLVSLIWQFLSFPFLFHFFSKSRDYCWATGRLFSTIFVSLIIWTLGNLGLSVNTELFLILTASIFSIIGLLICNNNFALYKRAISEKYAYILSSEIIFVFMFFVMGMIRGFNPHLNSIEKFMDLGFIKQYLVNAKLPVPDMWFAGSSINYYSFGHFWSSIVIRWWQVEPEIGFNLMLAFVFALTSSISFSVASNLIGNKVKNGLVIVGSVISALMVSAGGNSHLIWYILKNNGFYEGNIPYWYALATRFIENTITEFPGYTFVVADLHPHLIDVPIVLSFILLIVMWGTDNGGGRKNYFYRMITGFLLGVMIMTNTWDALIYIILLTVFQIFIFFSSQDKNFKSSLLNVFVPVVVSLFVSATWWSQFDPIPQGIKLVTDRSSIRELAILWSGHLLIGAIGYKLSRKNFAVKSIIVSAIILMIIPEFVYVVDILTTMPRLNTVFKFSYQTFILLSLLGGVVLVHLMTQKKYFLTSLLLLIVTGFLVYPFTAYPNFYLGFEKYFGLDGAEWLRSKGDDDFKMIEVLKNNKADGYLIEFPGHSFTLDSKVSVFSGVPTVLGWMEHEWLWRGDWEDIKSRVDDINNFFTANDKEEALKYVDKYHVEWIKVGKEERQNYYINDNVLMDIGEVVWQNGNHYLVKIYK